MVHCMVHYMVHYMVPYMVHGALHGGHLRPPAAEGVSLADPSRDGHLVRVGEGEGEGG